MPKFREALNNRKHPQKTGRGKVTMARYGAVASSPYTAPLISWQILEGTGETISKEAAELKVGQPGYWQLTDDPPEPPDPSPVRTSTGQAEAPAASLLPATDSQHVVTAVGTGTLYLSHWHCQCHKPPWQLHSQANCLWCALRTASCRP